MLTVSGTSYPADGSQPFKVESKWTRVSKGPAGSSAISGSWRIQNVNEDTAGSATTWKGAGDGLSMSTPTSENWEAKFDGKEYPGERYLCERNRVAEEGGGPRHRSDLQRDGGAPVPIKSPSLPMERK